MHMVIWILHPDLVSTTTFLMASIKDVIALTCFVAQYLTENSKNWVPISCLYVKITDVRIETWQKKRRKKRYSLDPSCILGTVCKSVLISHQMNIHA